MSTRNLLNLLLLAIGVGLVLIIIYQPGLTPDDVHTPLTNIDPGSIDSILIEREDYQPVIVKKQAGLWFLVGDQPVPAAEIQMNALTRILQASSSQQYAPETLDLAALGLNPPRATLTLNETVILIGDTDALESNRYILINNQVHLVTDQYQHLVNADWPTFVSRQLLAGQGPITGLTLPGLSLSMVDNQWLLTPDNSTISGDNLQAIIDNWQNASALYVSLYQPSDTRESVTIDFDAAPPITFQVITQSPKPVLARPKLGIQYHLTEGYENQLFHLPKTNESTLSNE